MKPPPGSADHDWVPSTRLYLRVCVFPTPTIYESYIAARPVANWTR